MRNIEYNNTIKKYGIYKLNNPIQFKPETSSDSSISIEYGIVISNQSPYLSKYDDKVIIIGYDNQFKSVIKQSMYTCIKNTLGEFIGIGSEENIDYCNKYREQLSKEMMQRYNNHADKKPYDEDTNRKQFLIDEENRLNKEIVALYKQIREKEKLLNNVTKKLNECR